MNNQSKMRVGIGFATGRRSFRKVLEMYAHNFQEYHLLENGKISLDLFAAYDLEYSNAMRSDFTELPSEVSELFESTCFIGIQDIASEAARLVDERVLSDDEAEIFFKSGYAARRNIILVKAIEAGMDCVLFLDDDEYPLALIQGDISKDSPLWMEQDVLGGHLREIRDADVTCGYHCGIVSPLPYICFDGELSKRDFRTFIEAISNEVVNWDSVAAAMENYGYTYADVGAISDKKVFDIDLHAPGEYISGSNLCVNLTRPLEIPAFYNPPRARGEDTFFGAQLNSHRIKRVPVYAFHDPFSTHRSLVNGVLPTRMKPVTTDHAAVIERFLQTCLGWIRYKPLLMHIDDEDSYPERMVLVKRGLELTLPKIARYFDYVGFMEIAAELDKYDHQVVKHHQHFRLTQDIWLRICTNIVENRI